MINANKEVPWQCTSTCTCKHNIIHVHTFEWEGEVTTCKYELLNDQCKKGSAMTMYIHLSGREKLLIWTIIINDQMHANKEVTRSWKI